MVAANRKAAQNAESPHVSPRERLTAAVERIAQSRGIALFEFGALDTIKSTVGEPLDKGIIRLHAHAAYEQIAELCGNLVDVPSAEMLPAEDSAALSLHLSMLRAAAARLNLDNHEAAAGFLLGASIGSLADDIIDSMSARNRELEDELGTEYARLKRWYTSYQRRQAQMKSAITRSAASGDALEWFDWLRVPRTSKGQAMYSSAVILPRLAKLFGTTKPAMQERLKRARARRAEKIRSLTPRRGANAPDTRI